MRIYAFRFVLVIALVCLMAGPAWGATDLDVRIATYLGSGSEAESQEAIAVAPDGTVVVGGTTPAAPAGAPTDLGGTTGTITRLSADGQVRSVSKLGAFVDDLDVDQRDGAITVAGDTGVALLSPDAQEVRWQTGLGPGGSADGSAGRRVAVGGEGTIAAMFGKTVSAFDLEGESLGEFEVEHQFVEDVAVDDASDTVVVTGFDNKRLADGQPVQVAFLSGYDLSGVEKWTNYAHDGDALVGNEADTRGYRVSMGTDGKLYFAGESAGGNTIFRFQPKDLEIQALTRGDDFQHAFNTTANPLTYAGRFDPADGRLEAGTMILPRRSDGKGSTLRPRAIAADEDGNVYVGGVSACCIPGAVEQTFSGQSAPGDYAGGAFVLALTPDFRDRLLWATWGPGGQVRGLAAGQGIAALAGRVAETDSMVTVAPLPGQERSASNASKDAGDGYISIWSGFGPGPAGVVAVAASAENPDLVPTGSALAGAVALVAALSAVTGGGLLLWESKQRRTPGSRSARRAFQNVPYETTAEVPQTAHSHIPTPFPEAERRLKRPEEDGFGPPMRGSYRLPQHLYPHVYAGHAPLRPAETARRVSQAPSWHTRRPAQHRSRRAAHGSEPTCASQDPSDASRRSPAR